MGVFWIFLGIILILCTIVLLIFAVRQHQKVSSDKPFDDTNRQIDFDDSTTNYISLLAMSRKKYMLYWELKTQPIC